MNERLLKLALQAKIEFTVDPTETPMRAFAECWEDELEKFAELIVRECADLCDRFQARDVGMQPAECAGAIRKMFGVE